MSEEVFQQILLYYKTRQLENTPASSGQGTTVTFKKCFVTSLALSYTPYIQSNLNSENRRHFQLTCQGRDPVGVEEAMRKAWEALSTKERLKYYQRAYIATTDESRHSTPQRKLKTGMFCVITFIF